ncbi:MAG: aminoglycoside phosphotransferase, partial [Actinoplanes sp.]
MRMHADQLTVPAATARRLITEQFPEWAGLPVEQVPSQGTVNAIFRVGEGLTARFPLKPGPAPEIRRWLEKEAAAARLLAGRTRFPTPEHVAIGEPGESYPLPWSVQTWLHGFTAT